MNMLLSNQLKYAISNKPYCMYFWCIYIQRETIYIKHSIDDLLNNENIVTMFVQQCITNVTQKNFWQLSANVVITLCVCRYVCELLYLTSVVYYYVGKKIINLFVNAIWCHSANPLVQSIPINAWLQPQNTVYEPVYLYSSK